jgi:putative transposase
MSKPYSNDLRERLVGAVAGGLSCRAAAARFSVSPATAVRWVSRWRQSGSYSPRAMGGDRRSRLGSERDWLLARIEQAPDLTLRELQAELRARKVVVGYGTLWRFFDRAGISFKKKRAARRAGPAKGRPPPGAVEEVSKPA